MKKLLTVLLSIIILVILCATRSIKPEISNEIDQFTEEMMNTHDIPGLAIGVVKDGELIHRRLYGVESLASQKALSDQTLFKVFSLTKTFVAISIFKLVEEGKLSIDDKLSFYFEDLPEPWQNVQLSNLLSHSSGLPDIKGLTDELGNDAITDQQFIAMLYNDEMEFITGEQWNYNQTNYILLKMIIESKSDLTFDEYVINHQFPDSDKSSVLFSCDTLADIPNQATYYNYDKGTKAYKIKKGHTGIKNHPLAGIQLTLDEYIKWNQRLDKNIHVSKTTKQLMWTPFRFQKSDREFLHGWDVYKVNGLDSYGFSGGGVSGFRKFIDQDLSIIVLTTGSKNYAVQDVIIDRIAGIIDHTLKDENMILTEKLMSKYFLKETIHNMGNIVKDVIEVNKPNSLEEVFKSIGYTLFFQLGKKEEALELFKLNVENYPQSYDTHGSLGYLYFLSEDFVPARENYIKALELNPMNSYSERRINEIDSILQQRN